MTPGLIQGNFIEDLSDFPQLVKSNSRGFCSLFGGRYVLPREVPVILHTTISNPRFTNDVIEMNFKALTQSCRLEIVNRNLEELKGVTIEFSSSTTVDVVFESHRLNANFPQGTEFVLKPSCDLKLVHVSRKIFPRVQGQRSVIKLGSENVMLL